MPFVSFEGIDGSGKTTQLEALASWLEEQGEQVVRTREPGGGALGAAVRAIFVRHDAVPMSAVEQLLLVNAARYDHVRSVVRPALERGAWVLSDRFYDSTFALQVFETDVPENLFATVRDAVVDGVHPDLTVVLDLNDESASARRGSRGVADDPLEAHRNFERIRRGFLAVCVREPGRCQLIDASKSPEEIAAMVQRLAGALRSA